MRVNEEGWLEAEGGGPEVKRYPTVRTTPLAVPHPLGVVWHWTAGRGGPGFGEALAREAQTYRRGVDRAASWHVLIAKDGVIYQSAPFAVGTWHVGRLGVIAGRLLKLGEGVYCWPYFTNPDAPEGTRRPDARYQVADDRAVVTGEGLFDAFTAAQESSAEALARALAARYGLSRDVSAYGHVDFDSPRKEDPGPVWRQTVLPRVLDRVFGGGAVAAASNPGMAGQGG